MNRTNTDARSRLTIALAAALLCAWAACGHGGEVGSTSTTPSAISSTAGPIPAASASTSAVVAEVSAKPSATVPARVDVPPMENPSVDTIPELPLQGAIEGHSFPGKAIVLYYVASGSLDLLLGDPVDPADPCHLPAFDQEIRFSLLSRLVEVGKPTSASHSDGLIYAGYRVTGEKNNWSGPHRDDIAYAYEIERFDRPTAPHTRGSIKVKAAVRMHMRPGDKPTWFTGTYDGVVCGVEEPTPPPDRAVNRPR